MDIDVLIDILTEAKSDGLEKAQIMLNDNFDYSFFAAEDIAGFSYNFNNDSIILFPEYF